MTPATNPFNGIFISDADTETDLLYYDSIARTIVNLIRCSGEKPISIGVHGDWGAGKTSVLKMTQRLLATDQDVLCLWFNGWQFEDFEDAKAALIETIILELRDKRSKYGKVTEAAKDVFKRLDYLKLAKMAVKYGGTYFTGIPHPELIKDAYDAIKTAAGMMAERATPEDINKSLEEGSTLLERATDRKKVPEEMQEFHNSFKTLLNESKITRLVVFIDDLDRCLPETAISTLEAIRLFLFTEKTAFVIGADEQMIEYSVKKHFPDLPKSGVPDSYSRSYLEKLIQVPFRIPSLGPVETQCYVTLVMAEAILTQPENKDAFMKLTDMAKVSITKPWEAQPLDANQIESVIKGDISIPLKEAVCISAQIYRVLSDGTKGNPRLIKRFLNAVLLRYSIAAERQLGSLIKFPQLAKMMLAERFHPAFFDKLVSAVPLAPESPNVGKVAILRLLEKTHDGDKAGKAKEKMDTRSADETKLLEEWKQDAWVITWAKVRPFLSEEDLRPYIFVTRDRRQSLFGYALGSKLAELIERLCQDEFTISAANEEVKALNTREVTEVAQHLKTTIISSGDFGKKPRGYDGLLAITTLRSETRMILLNLFQNLPPSQLGGWAWPGLKGVLEDQALSSEAALLVKAWEGQGSTGLKKAMKAFKE